MSLEGPQGGGDRKTEIEGKLSKIEDFRAKLEVAETALKAELDELRANEEMATKIEDVPKEKEDWYMGTISKSYEKAQEALRLVTVFGVSAGAIGVLNALSHATPYVYNQEAVDIAIKSLEFGYGTAALCAVGMGVNYIRAKMNERARYSPA